LVPQGESILPGGGGETQITPSAPSNYVPIIGTEFQEDLPGDSSVVQESAPTASVPIATRDSLARISYASQSCVDRCRADLKMHKTTRVQVWN
jgi:hypothetical protein